MSARAEIAAALTATGVVHVTDYYRQTLKPGQGFVRWARQDRSDNRLGRIDTWEVWVALSQDNAAAEQWLDAHLAELVAAFDTEATVTEVTANELALGPTTVNGIVLSGARAAGN
jgi:hypothetical protein